MSKHLELADTAAWKKRFRATSILWATIANLNPQRGLVCTDRDGVLQLYAWDVPAGHLRQLTKEPAGVVNGLLSAEGQYVYYLQDEGGNEIGHYVRIPFAGGAPENVTPELPAYSSFEISQSFRGNLLGTRLSQPDGHKLYLFAPGQVPYQLYQSQSIFFGPAISDDGEMAVIATTEGANSLDTRLIAFDLASGEQLELRDGEGISHNLGEFAPLPGDFRFFTTSSQSGYARPIIWNPRTGSSRSLKIDDIPGEVNPWRWSRDGKRLLLSQLYQAKRRLYLYDLERDTFTQLQYPDGVAGSYFDNGCFTDDDRILITWQDSAHPARLIAVDGATGQEIGTVLSAGEVPPGRSWKSITYGSKEGAAIQGWLALPEGEGPFPTIFHTHGGPTAVMSDYYSPESQAWLDHGFAFFTINYHGSTTFGREFEKSILGRLGELEIQDMVAGYHWLVENEIAQPGAVFLTGDSYGGYLTLLAMGKAPSLWAGGMAGVAIADWAVLYEDESESLRGYQRLLFGGTPQERPEAHQKSSPITYAENIQAPILVIQGRNDTRCPSRQMQVYEARLKALGKQIDVHWFEAGHGSRAQEQRLEHQEQKLRFVYQVLGE